MRRRQTTTVCATPGTGTVKLIRGPAWQLSPLHRKREPQNEGSALAWLAGEIDGAVVQLDDAEGHGQPDAGSLGFGGVVEPEDLVAQFRRDAYPRVADANLGLLVPHCALDPQFAAVRHGLNGVDHHVENGLFHQVGVYADVGRIAIRADRNADARSEEHTSELQ